MKVTYFRRWTSPSRPSCSVTRSQRLGDAAGPADPPGRSTTAGTGEAAVQAWRSAITAIAHRILDKRLKLANYVRLWINGRNSAELEDCS